MVRCFVRRLSWTSILCHSIQFLIRMYESLLHPSHILDSHVGIVVASCHIPDSHVCILAASSHMRSFHTRLPCSRTALRSMFVVEFNVLIQHSTVRRVFSLHCNLSDTLVFCGKHTQKHIPRAYLHLRGQHSGQGITGWKGALMFFLNLLASSSSSTLSGS